MKTIVKIKDFGLTKLNNAEYTNFSTRVLSLVKQAGTRLFHLSLDKGT